MVLDRLRVVVDVFEVVVDGCRWFLGGFRSFYVLVTTVACCGITTGRSQKSNQS